MTFRILSLDIDGVLHPTAAIEGLSISEMTFSPKPTIEKHQLFRWCSQLEEALSGNPDIAILIHSNWRRQHWATNEFFRHALGPLGHRFIGIAPADLDREDSISNFCTRFDVQDCLIVDDAYMEFKLGDQTPNLIVTDPLQGVNDTKVLSKISAWSIQEATTESKALIPKFR